MKNLLLEITEKLLIPVLGIIAISGIVAVFYTLITDPSTASNATWGIFDTLGD